MSPSSPASYRMDYDFWRELANALHAVQGIVDNPQPPFYPPSASANWDGGPPPVVTQYHHMDGGHSTSNDQAPALAHLHDAGSYQSLFPSDMTADEQFSHNASFSHFHPPLFDDPSANNLGFSGNVAESHPIEGHPHPVHDNQSESHASGRLLVCKWNNDHGPCNKTIDEGEIANHLRSSHLPRSGCTPVVKCQWKGCKLPNLIRRDTIIRHIRQIHLKIKPRRQS
ncbi:hypothetical protein DFJ58DRAFT_808390 [Suillus subalutaceus]|uniref:uncharacterized protein n=1 Tax=Suillus subalutaceus TaxID=48586 RepID=UPI001B85DBA0|nr:uncharacterized protein DFJ58DRAFT_808390 [Suillus subalutaceus]KAG1841427.1 hypothetical protein DFJ58DRAFT_808390 [Suillus subalutaceus]